RAVLALGHTPTLEPRAGRDSASQLAHQPRLPDPRLARDQDGSGLAAAGLAPALEELVELAATPDERRLADPRDGVPPAAPPDLPSQPKHGESGRPPPPLDISRRLRDELTAQQTVCVGAHEHVTGGRPLLDPRGKLGCQPDEVVQPLERRLAERP